MTDTPKNDVKLFSAKIKKMGNFPLLNEKQSKSLGKGQDMTSMRVVTSWEERAMELRTEIGSWRRTCNTLEEALASERAKAAALAEKLEEAEERRKQEKRTLAAELADKADERVAELADKAEARVAELARRADARVAEAREEAACLRKQLSAEQAEVQRLKEARRCKDAPRKSTAMEARLQKAIRQRKELEVLYRDCLETNRELRVRNGELEVVNASLDAHAEAIDRHYVELTKTSRASSIQVHALRTALAVLATEFKDPELVEKLLAEATRVVSETEAEAE